MLDQAYPKICQWNSHFYINVDNFDGICLLYFIINSKQQQKNSKASNDNLCGSIEIMTCINCKFCGSLNASSEKPIFYY